MVWLITREVLGSGGNAEEEKKMTQIYTGGQRSSRNPKVRTYQRTRSTTYGTLTITMDPANSAARLIVSLDGEPVETP